MRIFVAAILLVVHFSFKAQKPTNSYSKLSKSISDTARINCYNVICEYYLYTQGDSANLYNKRSLDLARQKKLEKYNLKGYLCKAEILRIEKKFDEASATLEEAKKWVGSNGLAYIEIRKHLVNGAASDFNKDLKSTLENYLKALEKSKKLNDKYEITLSSISLAVYYKKNNDNTNSLNFFLESYRTAKEIKNAHFKFTSCINLGTLYEKSKENAKALEFYRNAQEEAHEENSKAICYFKLSRLFANVDNGKDSSRYYINKTMEIHLKRNDEVGLIFDYSTLASIYAGEGKIGEAEKYWLRSLDLAFKYKDSVRIISVYSSMASLYRKAGNTQKALATFELSLKYNCIGAPKETVNRIYKNIAEIYKDQKKYKEAYEYYVLYKSSSDSMNNVNETKRQTELKLEFEFDQVQEKLKAETDAKELINQAERDKERQQRNYLLAVMLLITLFLFVAIRSYTQKRKANFSLEKQKRQIEHQKKIVEQKNQEISDSINYALRIQTATLPEETQLKTYFKDYGLFFKPKDVVSGDFYWAAAEGDTVLFSVADCTGHGVPGAITSMIGSILLNEIFYVKKITDPAKVLTELNRLVKLTLKQDSQSLSKDGMDIAFCTWNKKTNRLLYAGANRPLYLIKAGEDLREFKATKVSVGGGHGSLVQEYDLHAIDLQPGDSVILSSDGYADQFGGNKEKKFTTKAFKQLLKENASKNGPEQKEEIKNTFENWKGIYPQTDDVLVLVLKV